ncbi:hypothetical protein D3C72_2050780 [compost metagenome]
MSHRQIAGGINSAAFTMKLFGFNAGKRLFPELGIGNPICILTPGVQTLPDFRQHVLINPAHEPYRTARA